MSLVERWFVGDSQTGQVLADLRPESGQWSRGIAQTSINVTVPAGRAARALADQLRPWKHMLGCDINGSIMACGPITSLRWNDSGLVVDASGPEAYLGRREVINPQVKNHGWEMYDHAQREPAFWAATSMGMDGQGGHAWDAILGWFVKQALNWPGSLNIRGWISDAAGAHGMWIDGIDHRAVAEILNDVQGEFGGIEWDVAPLWSGDTVLWDFVCGLPLLTRDRTDAWSQATIRGLDVVLDGSEQVTHQHVTGRAEDGTPISVTAVKAGFNPAVDVMLERTDSGRTTEDDRARLQRWAQELLRQDANPWLDVSLTVPVGTVHLWDVGDYGLITHESAPWIDGRSLRVLQRSGSVGADRVSVRCAEVQS